jgi:hypothetical protein
MMIICALAGLIWIMWKNTILLFMDLAGRNI